MGHLLIIITKTTTVIEKQQLLVKIPDQGVENLKAYQGDSHKQNELTSQKFDLIFGCNLIDRLQYPRLWLHQSKVM